MEVNAAGRFRMLQMTEVRFEARTGLKMVVTFFPALTSVYGSGRMLFRAEGNTVG